MSEKQLIILIGSLLLIAGSELSVFLDNGKTSLEVMESLLEENGVLSNKLAYFMAFVTMTVVLAVLAFLMSFVLYEVFEIFISLFRDIVIYIHYVARRPDSATLSIEHIACLMRL